MDRWLRHWRARALWTALGAACTACTACSDGSDESGPPASSGVDSGARVADLSTSELAKLCDWAAAMLGGYGHRAACGDADDEVYPTRDQAQCLASGPPSACVATISEYEACVAEIAADPCSGKTIIASGEACPPLDGCFER